MSMSIRTSEELKAMFLQSKQRKERERQQKRLEKQKQYQRLCKEADRLLKEEQERAKRERMEQLQALAKKTPQKALKQPQIEFEMHIYNSNLIEREPNDRDLYQTREELMQWEKENWHCINWSKWDEIVNNTRHKLEDYD